MTHSAVASCLAGRISPGVALARLVLDGLTPDEIGPLLPAGSDLANLFAARRAKLTDLATMLRESRTRHDRGPADPAAGVHEIAAMFDRAVAVAPEASVAAYSLGGGALLAAATDELVAWLVERGLARRQSDVLDLGCGIGRVAAALAPIVRSVLGVDISAGMIAEARRRHTYANLRFDLSDGRPGALPDASFDLVLAVDSMPYLVQADLAALHVGDAARLLRPGGALAIFNLSYRGDDAADLDEAQRWATTYALRLATHGERPFRSWDGAAYVMRKAA